MGYGCCRNGQPVPFITTAPIFVGYLSPRPPQPCQQTARECDTPRHADSRLRSANTQSQHVQGCGIREDHQPAVARFRVLMHISTNPIYFIYVLMLQTLLSDN
jgi:hypothetical protein